MSISPKLANSTPEGPWAAQHERLRIQPDVLRRVDGALRVISSSLWWRSRRISTRSARSSRSCMPIAGKVILMPEGIDSASCANGGLDSGDLQARGIPV